MLICSSPKLFAACHVLHRLPMPRHSPYALLCLNYLFKSDLWSFLKLFSRLLELLCLRTFSFFTVTLACLIIAFGKINSFLLPALLITEKPDFFQFMIFSLLSLSCTLIRFSMSIQAFKLPFVRLYNYYISLYSLCKDRQPFGCLVMGSSGLEPPTSRLSGARSNLLSYEPVRENGPRKPFC